MRALGYSKNREPFKGLAYRLPLKALQGIAARSAVPARSGHFITIFITIIICVAIAPLSFGQHMSDGVQEQLRRFGAIHASLRLGATSRSQPAICPALR